MKVSEGSPPLLQQLHCSSPPLPLLLPVLTGTYPAIDIERMKVTKHNIPHNFANPCCNGLILLHSLTYFLFTTLQNFSLLFVE